MKTHIIPDSTVKEVYGKPGSALDHWERFECNHCGQPSINPDICVHCGREIGLTITPQAGAVKPLKPTLEDFTPELTTILHRRIDGLLADAEALSDEIEHYKAVAQRAQQREVEAVKRFEAIIKVSKKCLEDLT